MQQAVIPKILIVDRSLSVVTSLEYVFKNETFDTFPVSNIDESDKEVPALKNLDVILLVVNNHKEGIELIKNIRQKTEASMIMISDSSDESYKNEAIAAGASFFITKPFYDAEVSAKVHYELYKKHGSHYAKIY